MTNIFELIRTSEFVSRALTLTTLRHGTRLRKVDENGQAAVSEGLYEVQGDAVTRELKATGIIVFLGFEVEADIPTGTELLFQISNDGGATFKWWTGTVWATAGANDFNDPTTVDENIEDFPTGQRRFVMKIRWKSNAGRSATPRLQKVFFNYDVRYNWFEDVKRSLKRYIDANFRVPIEVAQILGALTNKVRVNTDFVVETVTGVYNLSADPGRTTNLYLSKAAIVKDKDRDGRTIMGTEVTMTVAQAAGSIIEVQFRGSAKVYIAQADSDVKVTDLPAIVVIQDSATRRESLTSGTKQVERNLANKRAFVRDPKVELNIPVSLRCVSMLEEAGLAMVQEMQRIFEAEIGKIRSEATGEQYTVLDFTPFSAADVTDASLSVKESALILYGSFWSGESTELPVAEIIGVQVEYPYVFDATIAAQQAGS